MAVPVQPDSHKRAQVSLGEGMLPQGKQQPHNPLCQARLQTSQSPIVS